MTSRQGDPEQKIGFTDAKWFVVPGGGGVAEATDEAIYLAMSIRNVGSGTARNFRVDRWFNRASATVCGDSGNFQDTVATLLGLRRSRRRRCSR